MTLQNAAPQRRQPSTAEALLLKHKGRGPEAKYNVNEFNLIESKCGPVPKLYSREFTPRSSVRSEKSLWCVAHTLIKSQTQIGKQTQMGLSSLVGSQRDKILAFMFERSGGMAERG